MRYWGIKRLYPRLKFLNLKLRAYIALLRPFTLLAPLLGGLFAGIAGCGRLPADYQLLILIHGAVTLAALNAASNVLNQVTEVDLDRANKPYRPIPRGLVSREEAWAMTAVLYFVALARSMLINGTFALFTWAIACATMVYSLEPVKVKKRLWLGNMDLALARGLLGFMAAWSILGDPFQRIPLLIGSLLFVFLLGANTSKDFADVEGDRAFGIRTLPVAYGVKRAARISAIFYFLPFALLAILIVYGLLPARFLIFLSLFPLSAYSAIRLVRTPEERLSSMENNFGWVGMYLVLAGSYVLSAIALLT